MAKHTHKILLVNNKTWKCQLGGCRYFVHLGLQHLIVGMYIECWNCGEPFEADEFALKSPKPVCIDCRLTEVVIKTDEPKPIEPKSNSGRTPEQQKAWEKLMKEMHPDWNK